MEGLLNDFSYTIPVVNVTITKDVALSYAKTHAENGGVIFALVLLIFFGIVMTLIWLYLVLSACCCCCFVKQKNNNRGATQTLPRISPRSPMSPSRSSAPLKRKAGAPLSSVERYNDEDPMRQTVSLEREHRRYSFSCFYVVTILVSICLGICVAGVVVAQSKFDASAKTFLGDVEELMLDSADAMCTANAGSSACTAQSAGMFVSTAEAGTTGVLGGLVDFLSAIDDQLYPSLNATIDDLTLAEVDLNSIEAYTDSINANISLIQQYKDWLRASSEDDPTPLTAALPTGELPVVTAEQLAAVKDGRTAVATARGNADEVYGTISDFVATDVAQAVAEFNTSTPSGSTTTQLLEPLDQIFNSILQGRDMALKYHHLANEQGETYTGYLTQKTWAVTLIFLLPFLLQIIVTLLNRSYSKNSAHLLTSMCCNYFCLLFFIILAMVFSLLAAASSTVCEYHLELVAKIPTQNVTLNDVQISITPAVIEEILHCPASPFTPSSVIPDNNFIGILGAEGLFNISSQTDEAIAQVEEARTSFNPEAQIQDAIKELDSLEASTAFNVSDGSNILSYRTEVLDLLADLPPAVMNRDNATQRASLANYFITDPKFSWTDYQTSLTAVNTLLVGATGIPPGFLSAYSFQTAWNFTQATVADEPLWGEDVVFRPPTNLDDLMDGLAKTDPFTMAVNSAVASNVEVHTNLTAVLQALDGIQYDMESIEAVQANLITLQTQLNGTLYDLLDQAQGILTGLTAQEDYIRSLAAFVSTAPEYTKCGFVGEFYHEGFQDGFCGELHDSLSIMWPFMLAASLCLFVTFVTFSCFVRKPRWFRDPDYNRWQDRNNLTPGRTPRGAAFMLA